MSTRLMTKTETADRLRKTPKQLEWLIYTGNAPHSAKIGGRRMWREADVDAWIDQQFATA